MRFGVIGDVHGSAVEFMRILRRLEAAGVDRIIQVGDLVDRGPYSVECVRIARTWTFTTRKGFQARLVCLLGNHEENHVYGHYKRILPGRDFIPKTQHPDVTNALTEADYRWLDQRPHWFGFKSEDGRKWAFVHAGIPLGTKTPGWLGKNRASLLCRTGYLDEKTGKPLSPYAVSNRFWADEYDGRFGHVFFGHTSFRRISYYRHATGVDCSKMGRVAALLVDTETGKTEEFYEEMREFGPKQQSDPRWKGPSQPKKDDRWSSGGGSQGSLFNSVKEQPKKAPPAAPVGDTKPKFLNMGDDFWAELGIKSPYDE